MLPGETTLTARVPTASARPIMITFLGVIVGSIIKLDLAVGQRKRDAGSGSYYPTMKSTM